MQLQDYITQVTGLIHDDSNLDFTVAQLTAYVNEARGKCALDFGCVRQYLVGGSTIVNQETYPLTSGVAGAVITNGGGAYSVTPTVTFGPPPAGGLQATGFAIMSGAIPNLSVTQIGMTNWGLGYTSIPTVSFAPAGASAIATSLFNVIDFHSVSYLFGTQRAMLQWKPYVYFNAVFRANSTSAGPPAVWSNYTEQNLFYLYPGKPDNTYPLEIDAYVLPSPLVNLTDVDTQINAPMNDCVQYYAAFKALLKAQNFEQASFYDKKYESRRTQISNTRYAVRRLNVYQNVYRRMQRGY